MMHFAVRTDNPPKKGLDNDICYSHEIRRSGGFWGFNSAAQRVRLGAQILFVFLLHHSHCVAFWLQRLPPGCMMATEALSITLSQNYIQWPKKKPPPLHSF